MNLNVGFLDSLVRRYFSLHHTMSVESAVCSIVMESLNSLKSIFEERPKENAFLPSFPNLNDLFTSTNIQKTLEEACLGSRESAPGESIPLMAEHIVRQGIIRLLERLEKPYVVATAKGFGLSKSALLKLPHSGLILFIARVALEPEFYSEHQEMEVLVDSAPLATNTIKKDEKSLTPPRTPRSIVETKKAKKTNGANRKHLRVNLFADEPLSHSKRNKPPQSPSTAKNSHDHTIVSPAKRPVIEPPAEIDMWALENACKGHREVPLSWLQETDARTAWMMLFNTSNVVTEELCKYRIPIGPQSSAWQLQQWFYSNELQKYCTDHKLPLKGKKKSLVISGILKYVHSEDR